MPPNCLWTSIFHGSDTQSQNLTRQVIWMEERRGKRAPQEQIPGPQYTTMMKSSVLSHDVRDPWAPRPGTTTAAGVCHLVRLNLATEPMRAHCSRRPGPIRVAAANPPSCRARLRGQRPARCACTTDRSLAPRLLHALAPPGSCTRPRPARLAKPTRAQTLAVRHEHVGPNVSEQQAHMIPKFGTEAYAKTRGTTPGGGASALGTAPLPMPGTRGSTRLGIYDSLRLAEKIVS